MLLASMQDILSKIKKDFAKFIGQSQKYDYNTNWISGADYLAKKD